MTSPRLATPDAISAAVAVVGVAASVPSGDAPTADIAVAKRCWLQACGDGSSPARVQGLYEAYRDLVISQVAAVVQGRTAAAS